MNTVLIYGGTVVDPSQDLEMQADVLCRDGMVSEIMTEPTEAWRTEAKRIADLVIDATEKIVCPGFIDIHMHEDPYDEETDTIKQNISKCMVRMGVTTAVGGNCGSNNTAPDHYLDIVDRDGYATNLALMAGHTFLRNRCSGISKYDEVDDDAIAAMTELGKRYLDAGCIGISFGVKYTVQKGSI